MVNLLLAQMQVIDFISGLQTDLVIITNKSNPAGLDEAEEMAKNIESISFINKNVMAVITNLAVMEVKELKAQILKLKVKLREGS